jgi:hypothetical protein
MTSALEKREARVGALYVVALASFFLPSIGTCGGIGAYKATIASSRVVEASIEEVANHSRTPAGTFVATHAQVRVVARGKLPFDDESVIDAPGAALFSVAGEKTLLVYSEDSACPAIEPRDAPVRLQGQVCDGDEKLLCDIPSPLHLYLQREAHLGRPHRLLVAGATAHGQVWEAACGLGIALFLIFAIAGMLLANTRARRGAHLHVERSVVMRGSKDAARAAFGSHANRAWRLAEDRGNQLTFLVGAKASSTRLMGVRSPDDVARRVAIRFEEQNAYRAGLATVTVTEILPFPRGVPARLHPIVLQALNRTLSDAERMIAG